MANKPQPAGQADPKLDNLTGTSPAVRQATLPLVPTTGAAIDDSELAGMAGLGNEQVGREDMATPFLFVVQSNSPEAKRSDPRYVPGAEEGMFIHTLSKRLYDGKQGLEVIDCYFEPLLLRWAPRNPQGGGGGFRGIVDPSDPVLAKAIPGEKNSMSRVLPDGTEVNETNQHYIMIRPFGSSEPFETVVLGLSSTQLKKSRQLNALINLEKVNGPNGPVPIPRFGVVWKLNTIVETKGTNTWMGVHFDRVRRITKDELPGAIQFYKAIAAGTRRTRPTAADVNDREDAPATSRGEANGTIDDTIPF